MNLCGQQHDEVCYEVSNCPMCDMLDEMGLLERGLSALNKDLVDCKDQIAQLNLRLGGERRELHS